MHELFACWREPAISAYWTRPSSASNIVCGTQTSLENHPAVSDGRSRSHGSPRQLLAHETCLGLLDQPVGAAGIIRSSGSRGGSLQTCPEVMYKVRVGSTMSPQRGRVCRRAGPSLDVRAAASAAAAAAARFSMAGVRQRKGGYPEWIIHHHAQENPCHTHHACGGQPCLSGLISPGSYGSSLEWTALVQAAPYCPVGSPAAGPWRVASSLATWACHLVGDEKAEAKQRNPTVCNTRAAQERESLSVSPCSREMNLLAVHAKSFTTGDMLMLVFHTGEIPDEIVVAFASESCRLPLDAGCDLAPDT